LLAVSGERVEMAVFGKCPFYRVPGISASLLKGVCVIDSRGATRTRCAGDIPYCTRIEALRKYLLNQQADYLAEQKRKKGMIARYLLSCKQKLSYYALGGGADLDGTKVVVRYRTGAVIRGFSQDFSLPRDRFHFFPADASPGRTSEVIVKDLKAVFVVRNFGGNPGYRERKGYVEGERPLGQIVQVTFDDGEVQVGTVLGYDPTRPAFFLFPADPMSNNITVFAVFSAVKEVRHLDFLQR
jgi:hypothetical protein